MGSQAMHMRHNLTTVPLARVGTEVVGGWLFFAVWHENGFKSGRNIFRPHPFFRQAPVPTFQQQQQQFQQQLLDFVGV